MLHWGFLVLNRPPYEQIALPLADELQGRSRNALAETVGVPLGTLNNVLAGWRRPTAPVLSHLLFLAHNADFALYSERLRFYSEAFGLHSETQETGTARRIPSAAGSLSRTHRIRLGRKPLRIGVLDYSPWATAAAPRPSGLIPDLLAGLTDSMGIESSWSVLSLTQLVEAVVAGDVDVAAGFLCRTPFRTTRTVFVPLGLPGELGIQAVTRAQVPAGRSGYADRRDWLEDAGRSGALKIVVVEGELAWDYRRSLLGPDTPIEIDAGGRIEETLERYWDRDDVVIFTDHVTAGRAVSRSQAMGEEKPFRSVYGANIGSFAGGFLLPVNDREFLKFFQLSWEHLVTSRMPIVGETLLKYAAELAPFLARNGQARGTCVPLGLDRAKLPHSHLAPEPRTLFAWIAGHWPVQIPVPDAWAEILAVEQRYLNLRNSRLRAVKKTSIRTGVI